MAAKKDSISHIRERFICAICFTTYQSPKTFPCFHSYCGECVVKLPQKKHLDQVGYECPTCRQFALKEEVKVNFFVNDLANLVHNLEVGQTVCIQCNSSDPQWRCLDCKIRLCEKCQLGHVKIPVCRGHQVQAIAQDVNPNIQVVLDEVVLCKKHPFEIIKFHCKTCEAPICIQCKVLEHDSHQAETIDDAVENITQKLRRWKVHIDEDIVIKSKEKKVLQRGSVLVKNDYDEARRKVKDVEKKTIEKAKQDAKILINELNAKEATQNDLILNWKDAKENELKKHNAQKDYLNVMLDMSKGVSLMMAFYSGIDMQCKDSDKNNVAQENKSEPYIWQQPDLVQSKMAMTQSLLPSVVYKDKTVSTLSNIEGKTKTDVAQNPSFLVAPFFVHHTEVTKTLDIPKCGHIPHRFAMVHSQFYVVNELQSKIIVLSIKGTHIKDITEFKSPTSIVHEEDNNVVVSSRNGVQLYDTESLSQYSIYEGEFTDVSYENKHIVAVSSIPYHVLVFSKQAKNSYCLRKRLAVSSFNVRRVLVHSECVYIHCADKYQVIVYNLDGKEVMKISTKSSKRTPNKAAKLCLVDAEQSMIFADWYYGVLEVHAKEDGERKITVHNFPTINDVVLFKDTLFLLAGRQIHKLRQKSS